MSSPKILDLTIRPRRLRRTSGLRALVQETALQVDDLILPIFVVEGEGEPEPIESMPNVFRLPIPRLIEKCRELHDLGLRAVALFPKVPTKKKDDQGTEALNQNNLVLNAARTLKQAIPELILVGDLALDPYTTHGHDGVLDLSGNVDNDSTVTILAEMGVLAANAGIDIVAPSDMMDGRIAEIRRNLDESGHIETAILAYSAKFASAYYGPFREAVGSKCPDSNSSIDKRTYQLSPANAREAQRELLLDEKEGADFLMVKPAEPYLDVIRYARDTFNLPIVAYQVSGEYARIWAAAERGWLELDACMMESLTSIKRSGADLILTYFAERILRSRHLGGISSGAESS
ncbi:MAG: porphobilinogen synthase [Opitutae bacterium]|nr:porphobilinogen synthase [Opitutae bacterium]MBT5910821.1 porphobilinogen synthase [Opitutae bacterium]MBT7923687.1 porphobilinogen synthase [Opitutae bacterium]